MPTDFHGTIGGQVSTPSWAKRMLADFFTAYSSPAALFMCIVILLTSGFSVFTKGNWNSAKFVSSYL